MARARIMQIHSRKMNVDKDDTNFEELARCCDDFNGAQCKAICVEVCNSGRINLTRCILGWHVGIEAWSQHNQARRLYGRYSSCRGEKKGVVGLLRMTPVCITEPTVTHDAKADIHTLGRGHIPGPRGPRNPQGPGLLPPAGGWVPVLRNAFLQKRCICADLSDSGM
mmetsp:Transcript_568/g.1648  ORF Transcript_568/g.1648 Transcript_568/m.1648 type:complete len:167 (-) Transcript_568:170-670(-)